MPVRTPPSREGWYSTRYGVLIRNRIQELREAQGLTETALAARLGVTTPHVHYLESHRIRPCVDLLVRCAIALGVEPWHALLDVTAAHTAAVAIDEALATADVMETPYAPTTNAPVTPPATASA